MRFFAVLFTVLSLALTSAHAATKAAPTKPAPTKPAPAKPTRASTPTRPETPGVFKPFAEFDPSVFPGTSAESVVVCDAATGRVLYEKNASTTRAVASTQKLMTALIIAEDGDLYTNVRVSGPDAQCEQTKLGLKEGETYRRYDLLRILLVKSMNDVARCLARDNAGSIEDFAKKMNTKARELGMRRTNFVNPNGLTEPDQYSTAHDMARLALHAYRNRVLRGIMSTKVLQWNYDSGKTTTFDNTNKLLKYFGLSNGMKTGYTEAAGHCLVSSATDNGKHVICVLLGERRRENIWTDSHRLLSWGLNQLNQ